MNEEAAKSRLELIETSSSFGAFSWGSVQFLSLVVVAGGAALSIRGHLTAGTVLAFFASLPALVQPIQMFSNMADQYFLGPFVLTSATKKVNVAVYNAIKEYAADPAGFKTGYNQNYTVKNGGVGYGRLSVKLPKPVAKAYTASTNALAKLIASGKVQVPSGE